MQHALQYGWPHFTLGDVPSDRAMAECHDLRRSKIVEARMALARISKKTPAFEQIILVPPLASRLCAVRLVRCCHQFGLELPNLLPDEVHHKTRA